MAYDSNKKPLELTPTTSLADDDTIIVGDTSDTSEVVKAITFGSLKTLLSSVYQPLATVLTNTTASFTTALESKLNGIEASATADQTGAEIKTLYEAEADTNAFTDAEKTKLAGIETGADVTDTANVTSAGALMDSEVSSLSGVKTLTVPDNTTISSFGATLVDDADASTARTTLGLVIGTDVQEAGTYPDITSGAGVPSSTPSKVGDIYIDTTNDDAYIAVGTASSSDWEKTNDGAGGGISDGDKGDITVSSSGTVWTIDNDVVTFDKVQNISTNRILGRSTAGTGDIEALADADVRTIMGLSTSDSPQFAGINVGHATDTTITRVSAGVIAVEGTNVSLQGHTHNLSAITDVTATATELNVLDGIPATLTATELGYVDGVTSAIQTQLNAKAPTASPTFTGTVTLPTGLTGVIRADSGVVSVDTDVTDIVSASSTTVAGKVELATTAETNTGTDTGRAVTPDGLAGSYAGTKAYQVDIFGAIATGDGQAKIIIPSDVNGMDLVRVSAHVGTAGTTGTLDIQIRNATDAVDVLSTKLTIDSGETSSSTAATPAVINTSNDSAATDDVWYIDIDAVQTTAPEDLSIVLEFRLP